MGFSLKSILPSFLIATAPIIGDLLSPQRKVGPRGYSYKGEESFLDSFFGSGIGKDIVKVTAQALVGGGEETERAAPKLPGIVSPRGSDVQAGRLPAGSSNPQVQAAIQRALTRTNFNPQLQRLIDDTGVPGTLRQGRRTLGITQEVPRATKASPATVRRLAEED